MKEVKSETGSEGEKLEEKLAEELEEKLEDKLEEKLELWRQRKFLRLQVRTSFHSVHTVGFEGDFDQFRPEIWFTCW